MQVPHWIKLPQPSPVGPQAMFCCAQVGGTQEPESGAPHCPATPPPLAMSSTTVAVATVGYGTPVTALDVRDAAMVVALPVHDYPTPAGGEPGYEMFLEAIADPRHERHQEMHDWIGYTFDPHAFDLNAVNQRLARIKP